MAVNTQEFKIKISVEDGVTGSIKGVSHSAEEGISTLTKLGLSTVFLNEALELSKKIYEAVAEPIKEAINAYVEQEKAVNKLTASLRLVGQETESHVAVFEEFAKHLEETANVADEVTLNLVSMAKASGLSDAQTKQLIETSANLAAVTDKDVNSAFRELMGQYAGMPGRIAKMIPELAGFTDAQLRAGKGIEFLSGRIKGFAEQDAESLDGAFKRAQIASENFFKAMGKAIAESIGLGDILKNRADTINYFTKAIQELTPTLVKMGEAFRSIDWTKIAEGILAVAAAITIFKAAGLAVYAFSAIQAIGGLTAAITAMGGVAGILSQIALFFQGIAAAATAALAPLLPIIAVAVGIAALAAAIDIVVRNFGHLDDVLNVIKDSAKVTGQFLLDMILSATLKVQELTKSFLEFYGRITGSDVTDPLKNVNDGIDNSKTKLAALAIESGKTFDKLHADASKVDFGAAGEAVKLVNGLVGSIGTKTKEATAAAKDYSDATRAPIPNLQEQLKLLAQIKEQNAGLMTDVQNIGATQVDQIKNNLALELQRLDIKRKQLEIEGKLGGAQGENIKNELDKTKTLLEQKAAKQIDAKEHPNAVGPDNVKAISDAMGEGAGAVADTIGSAVGAIGGAMTGVGAVMGAVNGVLDFVQQIIDFIPQVLSKIANIFDSLTDLPNKILAGVNNLHKSLINFVMNFIPNLLKSIPEMLKSSIEFLFKALPKALESLLAAIPDIIMDVLNQLPDIIQSLVEGLMTNAPKILIMTIEFLVKNGPKIAIAIMKTIYIELPKAVIRGIIEGAKQLVEMLKNVFSGKGFSLPEGITDIPKKIEDAANNLGKKISKEASQIFSVKDLTDGIAAATKTDSITDAAKTAAEMIDKKFRNLWQLLKDAWQWVWDHIIQPIINALKAVWDWIYKNVIGPMINAIKEVWSWVYDNVIEPFINALTEIWTWVNDTIIQPFVYALENVWNFVYNNIMMPFVYALQNVWGWVNNTIVQPLYGIIIGAWTWVDNNIVTPLKTIGQAAFGWVYENVVKPLLSVADVFRNFKFPSFSWPSFPDFHWPKIDFSWPSLPEWHWPDMPSLGGGGGGGGGGGFVGVSTSGGHVGGVSWSLGGRLPQYRGLGGMLGQAVGAAGRGIKYAQSGAFVRGSDTVPFMGAPGEFIVNARASQQNLPALQAINSGQKMPQTGGVVIENITINSNSKLDADTIRREVIPALEKSLKRKSQDGEFLLDKNGIR